MQSTNGNGNRQNTKSTDQCLVRVEHKPCSKTRQTKPEACWKSYRSMVGCYMQLLPVAADLHESANEGYQRHYSRKERQYKPVGDAVSDLIQSWRRTLYYLLVTRKCLGTSVLVVNRGGWARIHVTHILCPHWLRTRPPLFTTCVEFNKQGCCNDESSAVTFYRYEMGTELESLLESGVFLFVYFLKTKGQSLKDSLDGVKQNHVLSHFQFCQQSYLNIVCCWQ